MTLTKTNQWTPRLLASVVGTFLLVLTPLTTKAEVTEAQQNLDTATPVVETSNQAASQVKILTPTADTVLEKRSSSVIVQYPLGATIELRLNGKPVDPDLIGRTETDNEKQIVIQTWYGVAFQNGENILTAQAVNDGVAGAETSIKVMVRGVPENLELETVEARIPADGRSSATVRGQFLDANGNRANWDTVVTLNASAGEFIGTDLKPNQPGFQVESKHGEFSATLRSGLEAQTVRIRAQAMKLEAFTQFQFDTALRQQPLLTGVLDLRLGARGTNYYDSLRDFLPPDEDNDLELDISSAAFTTGSIGEWQFTGAFNTDRALNKDCNCDNRLFRSYQSSELEYPVYGDSSTVEVLAPSTDNVYFRLERSSPVEGASPDFAMWGDYNTPEFSERSQEFTAIGRTLHGFKTNYSLGDLQITGLFANNVEGFQRDILPPDGTSGYYFLSRRLAVPGSEDIFIELAPLNEPGTVVRRERLTRGADYTIDYDRGSLLFKRPILRTAVDDLGSTLIRRIVVTYQFEERGEDSNIYGGRVRYHFDRNPNSESWIGATFLEENQGNRDFQIYGADALISLGENGHIIAEYAHSRNASQFSGDVEGAAYRLEAEATAGDWLTGRAYYRSTEEGFTNNATVSFVPGQTRYGAGVEAEVSPTTRLRAKYEHEDNFGVAPRPLDTLEEFLTPITEPIPGSEVDNNLTTITAGVSQSIGKANLDLDWIYRDRQDQIAPEALTETSSQLRSRLSVPLTDTLSFQALNETTLSNDVDPIYNDRTLVGLDWQVYPGVNINLNQQWYTRGQYEGQSITNLNVTGDYEPWENATLTGRYSITGGVNGMVGQGAIGLQQLVTLAPGLQADFSYEHIFDDLFGLTGSGDRFPQPYAVGQGVSALGVGSGDSFSVGLEYTDNPDFKASARFEHRFASEGSNTVISANAAGKISPALTALFTYDQASSSNQKLRDLGTTRNLRVGLAYRDPQDDSFNALLRYEYRDNPSIIPETLLLGEGTGSEEHVFAAEAIYAPNWRWEFYGKYALRHSNTFLAEDMIGDSTVSLAQLRATYRLGYNIDLVGEARWITQPSADYSETGFLLEAGYYLTPELRLSAGYALGDLDDPDFSGTRSAGGPYMGVTVKLDGLLDGFGESKSVAAPPLQEESVDAQIDSEQEQ